MECIVSIFDSLISLRNFINRRRISKENIVTIFPNDREFVLIYYGTAPIQKNHE